MLLIGLAAALTACGEAPRPHLLAGGADHTDPATGERDLALHAHGAPSHRARHDAASRGGIRPADGRLGRQLRCVGADAAPGSLVWSREGHKLLSMGTRAIVAVEMTNTQAIPQAIVGADFVVRDAQSRTYKATSALGEADYSAFRGGQRLGAPVPPRATVSFYLVFDVANDAQGLRMIFTGQRPASNRFEASVELGR